MKLIKNQLFQIMLLAAVVCCLQSAAVFAQDGTGATGVVSADQTTLHNGSPITLDRSNPNNALGLPGAPAENVDELPFYSLGFGGSMVLEFSCKVVNGDGPDLRIYEATYIIYPLERAQVDAWDPINNTWVDLGVVNNGFGNNTTSEVSFPATLAYTNRIRLTDVSLREEFNLYPDSDGFDVDAVIGIHQNCTPFPAGGQFVIGDLVTATPGPTGTGSIVYYWGSQWTQNNPKTGGVSPGTNSFKGFENGVELPTCGSTWTSRPGNSTPPPAAVGAQIAVIVSSNVVKNGPVLSGDIKKILLLETLPGYSSNPGHVGRGRVLQVLCSTP